VHLVKFGGIFVAGLMEILPSMRCWTLAVHQSLITACPQISRMLAKYFWKQLYTLSLVQSSQSSFHVLTILSAHGSFHHLQILLQIVMI
jgi:hypothetical protein